MERENKDQVFINISNIIEKIQDENVKSCINQLLNIIEEQALIIQKLIDENQKLKDENNRLKGEQGKPNIKPNNNKDSKNKNIDISSEKERKKKKKLQSRTKKKKKKNIKIHRDVTCEIDKSCLPADAEFKGYESNIVQDIKIEVENILFKKEKYYSASENKIYIANIPDGYEGDYGPGLKTLTLILKNECNMSEPKILTFFHTFGVDIEKGTISNLLIKNKDSFHKEKLDIIKAGLLSTDYQQTDHTGARVKGENWNTQILCNPLYTAFFTTEKKIVYQY